MSKPMDEYEVRQIIRKVEEEKFSVFGCLVVMVLYAIGGIVAFKGADDLMTLKARVSRLESQSKEGTK